MPKYEYACKDCGEHLEVVQSFKDDPLTECPSCAGTLRKVFGNIGIVFKGSGFYRTDSRASAPRGKGDAADKADAAGTGSGAAKDGTEKKSDGTEKTSAGSGGGSDKASTGGAGAASGGDKGATPKASTSAPQAKSA